MTKYDEYDRRVEAIVGDVSDGTFEEALEKFFLHLRRRFNCPAK